MISFIDPLSFCRSILEFNLSRDLHIIHSLSLFIQIHHIHIHPHCISKYPYHLLTYNSYSPYSYSHSFHHTYPLSQNILHHLFFRFLSFGNKGVALSNNQVEGWIGSKEKRKKFNMQPIQGDFFNTKDWWA